MGTIQITETLHNGRTATVRLYTVADDFKDATWLLNEWLWTNSDLIMATNVIMAWMRGEKYADHSVNVRYYVPGTVGHWFTILYRA